MKRYIAALMAVLLLCGCSEKRVLDINENLTFTQEQSEAAKNDELPLEYRLNALMPTDKNYVFSPLSAKLVLSAAANGAAGETKGELLSLLGAEDVDSYKNAQADIILANGLWLNSDRAQGLTFKESFAENMQEFFELSPQIVTEDTAVNTINQWCNEKTKGNIPSAVDSADFLSSFVNAAYFECEWAYKIEKRDTYKRDFKQRGGEVKQTDFMTVKDYFYYYAYKDIEILEMPYKDTNFSMYFIMSGDKRIDYSQYFEKLKRDKIPVSIPKFRIDSDWQLMPALKELGAETVFDAKKADFSEIFEGEMQNNVFADKFNQSVYIEVDEDGTKAAVKTNMNSDASAGPEYSFVADRPFTFILMDKTNNEVLFMGEYAYVQ